MAQERRPIPNGYHQGIITAITVLLGFSLFFLRFWSFEAPGHWSFAAISAALLLGVSIVTQFISLWRALQIAHDEETKYRNTLRWFLAAAILLFLSIALAVVVYSGII